MARGMEGMPVRGWKWVLMDGFSGEIGIIVQIARYTNGRKGGDPMTELVLRALGRKKEAASGQEEERSALMDGLEHTRLLMQQAYLQFDTVEDPDLVESAVFEIKALQARYTYLLRRVKALGGGR